MEAVLKNHKVQTAAEKLLGALCLVVVPVRDDNKWRKNPGRCAIDEIYVELGSNGVFSEFFATDDVLRRVSTSAHDCTGRSALEGC